MYLLIWMFSVAQDLPNDVAKGTLGVLCMSLLAWLPNRYRAVQACSETSA